MNSPSARQNPARFPEAHLPERLASPDPADPEQQAAAQELIQGPRKGVYGPFRALLHRPPLLRAVASVGECLRYRGTLPAAVREWTICVVALAQGNAFEWDMHRPLAIAAGVPETAVIALLQNQPLPAGLAPELVLANSLATELLATHRLADASFALARDCWGEAALVELLALVGYFTMVNWLMNVARTPGDP